VSHIINNTLDYFSNSLSTSELEIIFGEKALGAQFDSLKGKKIVDIGSRIGAVLYYAHIFTEASEIIGVESDAYFTKLSQDIVKKQKMQDRVKVVNADIFNQAALVKESDIVIMHNIFEMFYEQEKQQALWNRVKKELLVKSGQIVITNPSLEESLERAGIDAEKFGLDKWVKGIPLAKGLDDMSDDDEHGGCGDEDCMDDHSECGDENCGHDHHEGHHHHHHHGGNQCPIHMYQIL
jgi:precorrin-6B methylase 2